MDNEDLPDYVIYDGKFLYEFPVEIIIESKANTDISKVELRVFSDMITHENGREENIYFLEVWVNGKFYSKKEEWITPLIANYDYYHNLSFHFDNN